MLASKTAPTSTPADHLNQLIKPVPGFRSDQSATHQARSWRITALLLATGNLRAHSPFYPVRYLRSRFFR